MQISLLIQTRTLFHWRKCYYGLWIHILVKKHLFFFSFVINIFFNFFSHTSQHNIHSKQTKQNNRHILHILKVQSKGREKVTTKHVLHLYNHVCKKKHCQASIVEGLAPLIRAIAHSQVTTCRRLWIQYVFPHMCGVYQFCIIVLFAAAKPANNLLFCIKLIKRPESSLRRHKLGLAKQSVCSEEDYVLSHSVIKYLEYALNIHNPKIVFSK